MCIFKKLTVSISIAGIMMIASNLTSGRNYLVDSVRRIFKRYVDALPPWAKFWQKYHNATLTIETTNNAKPCVSILSRGARPFQFQSIIKFMEFPWLFSSSSSSSPKQSSIAVLEPESMMADNSDQAMAKVFLIPPASPHFEFIDSIDELSSALAEYARAVATWSLPLAKLIQETTPLLKLTISDGTLEISGPINTLDGFLKQSKLNCAISRLEPEASSLASVNQSPLPSFSPSLSPSIESISPFTSLSSVFPYLRESELVVLESQMSLQ